MAAPGSAADSLLRPDDKVIVFSLDAEPATDQDQANDRQKILEPLLNQVREMATAEHPAQVISVGGHVRFPGSYPLDTRMRVSDLIRAAGQLRESAYTLTAELTRRHAGEAQAIDHVNVDLAAVLAGEPESDLILQPYDILSIRELPNWREREYMDVQGEVLFPGRYPISQGETLRDIVQRAGGLTRFANAEGAVFVREALRERERKQFNQMADNLERELAGFGMQQAQMHPDQQQAYQFTRQLVQRLRQTEAVGRLVIDLPMLLTNEDKSRGMKVLDGDGLYIPRQHDEVSVVGEVFFPTSHLYQQKQSRDDYIGKSGGLMANADGKRIYVVRANGSVDAGKQGFWSHKQKIKAGDTIVVPLNADRVNPIRLWTDVSQILYQLAITAASLQTVGVF
jgi:protein involved in polysaccharide export with SLBB domain